MSQKNIKIFINEIYSKPPKKNYATNKTDVYHIDDTWSLDILDLKDYGSENNRGYRYVLVTIDNFSKFGWTVPLKNRNGQTIKDSFENYSRNSSYGGVFAERFNRTVRDLFKRPVFEKGDGNWIDILPTITKQYNNPIHSSTKLSTKDASLKKNEGFVYKNL